MHKLSLSVSIPLFLSKYGQTNVDYRTSVVQHEIVVRQGEDTRIPCDIQPAAQDRVSTYRIVNRCRSC